MIWCSVGFQSASPKCARENAEDRRSPNHKVVYLQGYIHIAYRLTQYAVLLAFQFQLRNATSDPEDGLCDMLLIGQGLDWDGKCSPVTAGTLCTFEGMTCSPPALSLKDRGLSAPLKKEMTKVTELTAM